VQRFTQSEKPFIFKINLRWLIRVRSKFRVVSTVHPNGKRYQGLCPETANSVISGMVSKAVLGVCPVLMLPFSFCGYALLNLNRVKNDLLQVRGAKRRKAKHQKLILLKGAVRLHSAALLYLAVA
jgi:hypothetical protein